MCCVGGGILREKLIWKRMGKSNREKERGVTVKK